MVAAVRWLRSKAVAVALLAALLMVIVPADRAGAASLYSLSGKVSLPAGAPTAWLSGLSVFVESVSGSGRWAQLDRETGDYYINDLAVGDYRIKYYSDAYTDPVSAETVRPNLVDIYYGNQVEREDATLVHVDGADVAGVDVTLALGRTISGTVSVPAGTPRDIRGAVGVYATADGFDYEADTTIDPDSGQYTIVGLAPGTYRVLFKPSDVGSFHSDGYVKSPLMAEFYNDSVTTAGATKVNVSSASAVSINAALTLGTTISGNVSLPSGAPQDWYYGLAVSVLGDGWGKRVPLDPLTGDYTVTGVPPGNYYVWFLSSIYTSPATHLNVTPNLRDELYDGVAGYSGATRVEVGTTPVTAIDASLELKVVSAFSAAPVPTISGTAGVGSRLTVSLGTWSPKPDLITYQWYRDGIAIAGARSYYYTASASDAGHQVSVMVRASKFAYTTVAKASARVSIPFQSFSSSPTPTVSGTPAIGSRLTVVLGSWSPKPDVVTYQWYRDGVAIAGARSYYYTPVAADAGHQLSVAATASKVAFTTTTKVSARVAVALQTFSSSPTPTITGTRASGNRLTVSLGTWSPKPEALAYQWYRNGVAITGAKYYTYVLTSADKGRQISVVVSATKAGYKSVSKASARVMIAP